MSYFNELDQSSKGVIKYWNNPLGVLQEKEVENTAWYDTISLFNDVCFYSTH